MAAAARSTNTRSFVEAFTRRGHDVHVATLHPGTIATATVHRLGHAEHGISRLSFATAIPAFLRLHRSLKPDVTLGYYASSYGLLVAMAPRPRIVVTAGGDVLDDPQDSGLRQFAIPRLAGFALRRADLVLCWAPHLEEAVVSLGVAPERILTLPRGIDVDGFRPSETPANGAPIIISTRSLSPFYRPELLLEAFIRLRERGVAARLELAGEGPSAGPLRTRARTSRYAADIALSGRLEPEALAETLRRATVYTSVPPSDGVSASLLEAMACGLVPVVTNLRTNRDWVDDGVNGLLVPEPVTVENTSAALERALGDEELRRRARALNVARVRERADRDRNVVRFEERFAALTRPTRNRT
jgi:glycosyltransferase involved in cell wall biosynthesis